MPRFFSLIRFYQFEIVADFQICFYDFSAICILQQLFCSIHYYSELTPNSSYQNKFQFKTNYRNGLDFLALQLLYVSNILVCLLCTCDSLLMIHYENSQNNILLN